MVKAVIARKSPFTVEVQAGKEYWWCACGLSKNQPFCDGSHKGTAFSPLAHTPGKNATVYFCGCKQSGSPPLCDGTHSKI